MRLFLCFDSNSPLAGAAPQVEVEPSVGAGAPAAGRGGGGESGAAADGAGVEGEAQLQRVSRINLLFGAEDPFAFAARVAEAHAARRRAEAVLRYNLYVDCMPTEDMAALDTEQVRCAPCWKLEAGGRGAEGRGGASGSAAAAWRWWAMR